jgi:alginate O-acetyltransferase complex protein AlgI
MIFNGLPFLVFFPLFLAAYYATRNRHRLWVCLTGSYVFYGWWDWRFLGLILLSTFIDYMVGLKLEETGDSRLRKGLLVTSISANLGFLAFFKYFNFFAESLGTAAASVGLPLSGTTLDIVLPVGISFYTFQSMSYSIDLYRRSIPVERCLLRFAVFVAFFPQLVAGPIVRASTMIPQLKRDHPFNWDRVTSGFGLALWGLFKKVVVADNLALVVDAHFAAPTAYSSLSLSIAVFFYAFQIYCDFSGYSDIAIGVARMLGFDFSMNFRTPYFSRNFSEFWRRWHISLSRWLRDYLYISLGGNRQGTAKTYRNLILTMLLGGLWHGASWTFVVWGALHGFYLVVHRLGGEYFRMITHTLRVRGIAYSGVCMAITFFFTCLAWIFFRAQTCDDAFTVIERIAALDGLAFNSIRSKFRVFRGFLVIGLLLVLETASLRKSCQEHLNVPSRMRTLAWCACLWSIAWMGSFDGNQFIYFQF